MEYVIDFITLMHDFNNQNSNAYLQLLDFLPQDLSDDLFKGVFLPSILFQLFFHVYFIGNSGILKSKLFEANDSQYRVIKFKLLNMISAATVTAVLYEYSHVIMIGTMLMLLFYAHFRNGKKVFLD